MQFFFKNRYLAFLFLPLLITSCISNKKHLAAIDLINTDHATQVTQLNSKISTADDKIRSLELNVAERIGENNILVMLRDELQDNIETLESNIENINSSSTSTKNTLSADLADRDKKIKELKAILAEVETTIKKHEDIIKQIKGDLNYVGQDYPDDIESTFGFDFATIDIKESFLFKPRSTSRLLDSALEVIEKFSEVFQKYPNIKVQVVGHTDTDPPRDKKRYGDNWNFSALQAATIVRTLIDEYDVSANQLTLSAKAEYSPKASNASSEGKSKNRRIEFYVTMSSEDLIKKIRTVLAKVE